MSLVEITEDMLNLSIHEEDKPIILKKKNYDNEDDDEDEQVGGAGSEDEEESEDESEAESGDESGVENEEELEESELPKKKGTDNSFISSLAQDEDEESDEEDEDYLQKFDSEVRSTFIEKFHPESIIHNYEEVQALAKVIRDADGIIIDDLHKTVPFLTKYEMTRVLGQRAKQINSGAIPLIKVPNNVMDGYLIAKMELEQKKIPFIIKRPIPNGSCEYWSVNDLELI
jgi:DNA-directed RNA polymerase I, II, and III subunit RPABC2